MLTDKLRQFIVAALFLASTGIIKADAAPFSLIGTWALQSMVTVDVATGKTSKDFGEHPKGYVVYTPDYMSVVINADGREPIPADARNARELQAKLFTTMTAHAGPYEFANGKLVNHVKVAHDPKMVGHDLVRLIRIIDNNHLESTVPPAERNGRRVKVVLIWERV